MFDIVENNKKLITVILAVVALSLVVGTGSGLFQGGTNSPDGETLATVGTEKVSELELQQILKNANLGNDKRAEVMDYLIRQALWRAEAKKLGLMVTEKKLAELITTERGFFDASGKFSPELYSNFLKEKNMTPQLFENNMAKNQLLQEIQAVTELSLIPSKTLDDAIFDRLTQTREIQELRFGVENYLPLVAVTSAEVQAYYKKNQQEFKVPEQAKVNYIYLNKDSLVDGQSPTDAEAEAYFNQHKAEYAKEERQARHILIAVDKTASAIVKASAKAKAESILAQLKKDPSQFAALAAKESADTGSAANGGDLGFQPRETFVKEFSDALFSLSKNGLSGVVETQFGYHIIQLADMRQQNFEQAKTQVMAGLKTEKATLAFASLSAKLKKSIKAHPLDLQAAATEQGLKVETSDWVERDQAKNNPNLNKIKFLEAVFSDSSVKQKQVTSLISLTPESRAVAQLVAHRAAGVLPFAEVEAQIMSKLKLEKASQLAETATKAKLTEILQTKSDAMITWEPQPRLVSQLFPQGLVDDALKQVVTASVKNLPAYTHAKLADGSYALYKIIKLAPPIIPAEHAKEWADGRKNWQEKNLKAAQLMAVDKAREKRLATQYTVITKEKREDYTKQAAPKVGKAD